MGTGPVRFHHTPFGTASGRCRFPYRVTGESFQAFRGIGKPFVFKGFGCADSVGIVGCGFHYLNRASIARRTHRFRWIRRGIQAIKEGMLMK